MLEISRAGRGCLILRETTPGKTCVGGVRILDRPQVTGPDGRQPVCNYMNRDTVALFLPLRFIHCFLFIFF